jgi:hypothetical protein
MFKRGCLIPQPRSGVGLFFDSFSTPVVTGLEVRRQHFASAPSRFAPKRAKKENQNMYMTQAEWDRRHHREEQQERRNEIISRVALFFSLVAIIIALYFMTMVP